MLKEENSKKISNHISSIFFIVNLIVAILAVSYVVSAQDLSSYGKLDVRGMYSSGGNALPPNTPVGPPSTIPLPASSFGAAPQPLEIIGLPTNFFFGHLVEGLVWGGVVAGGIYLIGSLIGIDPNLNKALSISAFAGIASGKLAYGAITQAAQTEGIFGAHSILGFTGTAQWGPFTSGAWVSFGIGAGVAIAIFIFTYKDESKKIVTFSCLSWEAPIGGGDCEKCNNDPMKPCSEYRCRSLGQACQLLNKGTGSEACAWVNPRDVDSPTIDANRNFISLDHSYKDVQIRPPGLGMKVVYDKSKDGCIKAFTPLQFGVVTNEPAQCKIDNSHTAKFDDMTFFFGGSNLYAYNHTQILSLPSPNSVNALNPEVPDDGVHTLFVRCKDANGNYNVDEFAIRLCVDKSPDTTAPLIVGTSVRDGSPVAANVTSLDLEVYVNEPAECKWSRLDTGYELMENAMSCDTKVSDINTQMVYTCKTTLNGIKERSANKYYFRCKDQPNAKESERNVNTQSTPFTIIGTEPLSVKKIGPIGTIRDSTDVISVNIEVETQHGYKNGDSICYYSTDNKAFIKFFETGTNLHKQRQDLIEGNYTYYVKCNDLGGNVARNSTSFNIEIDRTPPVVVRAYKDGNFLKIITDEPSTCKYSIKDCNFNFEEGIDMRGVKTNEHTVDWKVNDIYNIKCEDVGGKRPLPTECSLIARPYELVT